MSHLKVIQPEGWQRPPGFSWGMSASGGRIVTVAGQLATERGAMEVKAGQSFARQFAQSLQNVADVVAAAGGQPSDVAMMRAYVRDIEAFKSSGAEIRVAWMKIFGKHFPPMTMIQVAMLFDPNALVEIDALAEIQ
jgi:enamine deaminase RidA (YjgF/YER057c/UK114 family)